jgi:2-amino-4-hydroxy-6-hydroxymethyldihydropteridine diphosphokinase / dihydropteroate synthase
LQKIEIDLGRKRTVDPGETPVEKGPRTVDLDILLYGSEKFEHDRLTIPHPLLHERDFVLRPLNDIIPDVGVPTTYAIHGHAITVSKLYSLLSNRDPSISPVTELAPNLPIIRTTDPARPTRIMAILNLTPDSFSDGGVHDMTDLNAIRATVERFVSAGATIIDIGGQSTRPGAQQVSPSEELGRIIPVIRMIRDIPAGQSVAISIDTFVAEVARLALAAGADIVNDVSGGQLSNGEILSVVAEAEKTIILMHMRGNPENMNSKANYSNGVLFDVANELSERVEAAIKAGIPRWRIVVDPGIGFAKHLSHNLILLRDLDKLRTGPVLTGLPLLLGTSRKRFIGRITGVEDAASRVLGTAATVAASVAGGADIVRVHDVAEMAEVVKVSDAIYRRSHGSPYEISS